MSTAGSGPYALEIPPDFNPAVAVLETIITADEQTVDITGTGVSAVHAETFNGAIPGPLLRLKVGDSVIIRLINKLNHPTGIHWHGIELSNSADGTEVTQEAVVPGFPSTPPAPAGGTYLYKFTVTRPGVYWYHPHHHLSTNRVFRGLYGMIVVADPNEAALIASGVIPNAMNTKQLVLSDITVCKAPGSNDAATYVDPTTVVPAANAAEWIGGGVSQAAPAPVDLCEIAPAGSATNDDGTVAGASYAAGDVPSIMRPPGRLNEGQTVLTNGVNVGARAGTPLDPGALAPLAFMHPVESGQGLRLQIVNCAAVRYFRLILTTSTGVQVPLVRIGGEGGLLDNAVVEGGVIAGFDTGYSSGEILIPPASRVDVVAAIPAGEPAGSVLTMWTRDYPRLGQGDGFCDIPTVPVMHLNVTGSAASTFTIADGTPLRAAIPALVETLGAATGSLLNPAGFAPVKPGLSNQNIQITTAGGPGVDSIQGSFEGFVPYTSAPHIGSSRYAEEGQLLELSVTNTSPADHPFHLHGFSFQPLSLTRPTFPTYTWPYREFRDNINIPGNYTLTFRVRLDDRPLVDASTLGGSLGRWLFHCHIFFHHHQGMISELVVAAADGREKPNVDVRGSWAYTPSNGTATRTGTYNSPDGLAVTLSASVGTLVYGAGEWAWSYDTTGVADGVQYVYITAQDSDGRRDQTVFRLKIGAPDDGSDNGDPHVRTVDGKYYDFQAAGEFTLLRDAEGLFEIQTRQTPVPSATPITDSYSGLKTCVSVNTAVAVRIGNNRIAYQPVKEGPRLRFYLDGKVAELTEKGIDLEAGRVVAYPVGGQTALRIDCVNDTTITITPYFWSSYNIWILNVSVAHTDADQGIMGRIPAQTWLPLLPSGASLGPKPASLQDRYEALYQTFANAWRVTDATSLFLYAPGTSTKTFTDVDWPAGKPPCNLKPEFEIPGANPPLVNIKLETAERICKPVVIDDLHKGCVFDVATTGDKALVQSYLVAQEVRLKGTTVQLVADKRRTRPAEAVVFTATVNAMLSKMPTPTGTITFVVDDVAIEKPIKVDKFGRASAKTASLSLGVRRVRAAFTSDSGAEGYRNSSSPSVRHAVERRLPTNRGSAPYQLRGIFYEACDCYTICPCWLGSDPDEGACTGVFAWEIEQGRIDGVDVSGLRAVSVSHHSGPREKSKQRVVIFVDERATRQQADAMAAAFSGRLGGPMQELGDLLGDLLAVERADIQLRREGRLTSLTVDTRIRIEGSAREGPSGRATALNDGKLSKVLGSPAEVGESGRFRVGLAAHGMDIDLRGRSTMSGQFSYVHVPGKTDRPTPSGGHGA